MSEVRDTPTNPCPKCRGADIGMSYHKQGCYRKDCSCSACSYGSHHKAHGEHLHYYCRTCHYDWLGPVAGKKRVAA